MRLAHSRIAASSIVQAQQNAIFISTAGNRPRQRQGRVTMAHIADNARVSYGDSGFVAVLRRISDMIARRRVFKRTHAELSQLSTRELDDLGISRSMISRLAYEAAYGK